MEMKKELYPFDEARAKAGEPCIQRDKRGPFYFSEDCDHYVYPLEFSNGEFYTRNGQVLEHLGSFRDLFMMYPSHEAWLASKAGMPTHEEKCIAFAKWIAKSEWMAIWVTDKWMWECQVENSTTGYVTEKELYQIYLKETGGDK